MSQDPTIRQFEKRIANEARADQKTLDHAIKDLSTAESTHNKSIKSADKAQHNLDKAVKKEHKAATTVNKAHHNHEAALSNERTAEKNVTLKLQHEERLAEDLQKRRAAVEEWQHRKEANDQQREMKLSQIHAQAASRAGSIDMGRPGEQYSATEPGFGRTDIAHNGHAAAPAAGAAPELGPAGAPA